MRRRGTSSSSRSWRRSLAPPGAGASTLIDRNATGVTLKVDATGQRARLVPRAAASAARARLGRCQRARPDCRLAAGGLQARLLGRLGQRDAGRLEDVREHMRAIHGPDARLARDRLHRAGRQPLGAAVLAADAAELRSRRRPPKQAVWELRLSHWTGELPVLTVNTNWAYRKFDHLFGTFTYDGAPVHGFRSTARATRSTRSAGTSTSTRSTRPTAPAGSARTASSCTRARGLLLRLLSARQPSGRERRALPRHDHRPRRDAGRDVAGRRRSARTTPTSTAQLADVQRRCTRPTASASPSELPRSAVRTGSLGSLHGRGGRVRHGRRHRRHRAGVGRGSRAARRRLGRALLARGPAGDDGHELGRVVALHARGARADAEPRRRSTPRSCAGCSTRYRSTCRSWTEPSTPSARWPRSMPLAVASSSNRPLIDAVLDAAGIAGCFTVTVSSEEVRARQAEPGRLPRGGAAARRSSRSACAAVEDSGNGIRAAHAAGMRVIAYPNPHYPPDAEALALADAVIGSLAELVGVRSTESRRPAEAGHPYARRAARSRCGRRGPSRSRARRRGRPGAPRSARSRGRAPGRGSGS